MTVCVKSEVILTFLTAPTIWSAPVAFPFFSAIFQATFATIFQTNCQIFVRAGFAGSWTKVPAGFINREKEACTIFMAPFFLTPFTRGSNRSGLFCPAEKTLEPVCCKKQQKKVPDQLLVCRIGDLWRTWMIPNWLYMSPSDSPDHPGSILYHSESSEVPYSTNQ